MREIKPCKCGTMPYTDYGYYWNNKLFYFVKCPNCKRTGRDCKTEDIAIKVWNMMEVNND